MRKSRYYIIINSFLFAILFFGCEQPFNKLEGSLETRVYFPIGSAKMGVEDMVNFLEYDTLLSPYEEGLYKIVYEDTNFFSLNFFDELAFPSLSYAVHQKTTLGRFEYDRDILVDKGFTLRRTLVDIFDVPETEVEALHGTSHKLPTYTHVFERFISVETDLDNDYEYLDFSKGKLKVTIYNELPGVMTVHINLKDTVTNESIAAFEFNDVAPGDSLEKEESVAGKRMSKDVVAILEDVTMQGTDAEVVVDLNDSMLIKGKLYDLELIGGNAVLLPMERRETDTVKIDNSAIGDVEEVKVKQGSMVLNIDASIPLFGDVILKIPSIIDETGGVKTVNIPFDGITSKNLTIPLDDNQILFPDSEIYYDYTISLSKSKGLVEFNEYDSIVVVATFIVDSLSSVVGDFGQDTIYLPRASTTTPVTLDYFGAKLWFTDPVIRLSVTSNLGIPATFKGSFLSEWEDETKSRELVTPAFEMPVPLDDNSGPVSEEYIIDKYNANIAHFFSVTPSRTLYYEGEIRLNNDTIDEHSNFISEDGEVKVGFALDFPVKFRLIEADYELDSPIDLSVLQEEETMDVELVAVGLNGLPFEGEIYMEFYDSITNTLTYPNEEKLSFVSPDVDLDGRPSSLSYNEHRMSFTEGELDNLMNTNLVKSRVKFRSKNDGVETAAIYTDQKLEFSFLISFKVKVDY